MPQFVPDLSHSNAKLRHPTLILFASKCAKKKGPKGPFQNPLSQPEDQANHQRSEMREPSICHRLPMVPEFASLVECAST